MLQKKRLTQKNPVMRLIRDKARKYYKITETIGCKKKKKRFAVQTFSYHERK